MLDGVEQKPIEGVSLVYTFDNAKAPDTASVQYFEIGRQSGDLQGRLDGEHDAASAAMGDERI